MGCRNYRLNGVGYLNGRENMDAYLTNFEAQQTFQFLQSMGREKIEHSKVRYIQVLSGISENDALIKAGTNRKLLAGWYTVKYMGFLHPVYVLESRRNRYGQFAYRFWLHQVPMF
jgi:hypothetical protein